MSTGQISLKFRAERSYFGVPVPVLKSGLQKYLRRGDLGRGLWCLIELDLFSLASERPDEVARRDGVDRQAATRRAEALRTNTINRLIVAVSEEVNIHAATLPAAARSLRARWQQQRGVPSGRRHLVALYRLLLEADKCRIVSDYKTAFNLPPYYLDDAATLERLHSEFLRSRAPSLHRLVYDGEAASLGTEALVERAMQRALGGSDEALLWCGRMLRSPGARAGVAALWGALRRCGVVPEQIEALGDFYRTMTHQERPIYLYHALLLVAHRERLDARPPSLDVPAESEVEALYREHLAAPPLRLDDFVHDRHTGARSSDGRTVFAVEGARVENESTTFLRPELRRLYIEFKRVLDAGGVGGAA